MHGASQAFRDDLISALIQATRWFRDDVTVRGYKYRGPRTAQLLIRAAPLHDFPLPASLGVLLCGVGAGFARPSYGNRSGGDVWPAASLVGCGSCVRSRASRGGTRPSPSHVARLSFPHVILNEVCNMRFFRFLLFLLLPPLSVCGRASAVLQGSSALRHRRRRCGHHGWGA